MPYTSLDQLIHLSHQRGDAVALVSSGGRLTFAGLVDQVGRTAAAFRAAGIAGGDRVGLTARDGARHVAELFALWSIGAVAVPLDFRVAAAELGRLAREFDLRFVVSDKAVEVPGTQVVLRDAHWDEEIARAAPVLPDTPPSEGDAVISLTSGTTGRPVGIVMTHADHLGRATQHARLSQGTGRFAHAGLMSFSAVRSHVMAHLLEGSEVHFLPPLIGAGEFIERLRSEAITNAFVVPTLVRGVLALESDGMPLLPRFNCFWSGGSDLTREEKLAAHRRISPGFSHCFSSGLTGTVSVLAGDDLLAHPDTDGRIIDKGVRVEIVDENGNPMPPGEIGLLKVRTSAMASRIVGPPRENGDRLRDGWAFTGDLAVIDDDRFLSIRGRTGDMIVRGGANVYPAEVEHALSLMPGMVECAVAGVASDREGQEIAAFAVVEPGVTADDILAFAERELLSDKRPRIVRIVEALPRNANGKVLRRELRLEPEL